MKYAFLFLLILAPSTLLAQSYGRSIYIDDFDMLSDMDGGDIRRAMFAIHLTADLSNKGFTVVSSVDSSDIRVKTGYSHIGDYGGTSSVLILIPAKEKNKKISYYLTDKLFSYYWEDVDREAREAATWINDIWTRFQGDVN